MLHLLAIEHAAVLYVALLYHRRTTQPSVSVCDRIESERACARACELKFYDRLDASYSIVVFHSLSFRISVSNALQSIRAIITHCQTLKHKKGDSIRL